MSDADVPFALNGSDVSLTIYYGSTPLDDTDLMKSATFSEVNTQFRDKYCGRKSDRTDEVPGGTDCQMEFDNAGPTLMLAIIDQKTKRAANQPFEQISVGCILNTRDGQAYSVLVPNVTTKLELKVGGKDEHVTTPFSCQGEIWQIKKL